MDSLDRVSQCDLLLFCLEDADSLEMRCTLLFLLLVAVACAELQLEPVEEEVEAGPHVRSKRTLFLKKKILGAGLFGFGLGLAKGYKYGYHSGPEVHHVYLAPPPPPPPPVRYVEYIEKPVFVPKIIEKPVFKPHDDYAPPSWSSHQPLPDPVYGAPWL